MGYGTISDAAQTPWLEGSDLACSRGHEWLFENLSFEVRPAQMMWLRGRNGCGKTTLLRMIAGLTRPERGRLTLGGKAVTDRTESTGELVYIGHANALKDDLTASESLQFLARLHSRDFTQEAVMAALG
ncbi:MAG: ABC transporter ATP-binding protein, partial [Longimicrobiales bacterium]